MHIYFCFTQFLTSLGMFVAYDHHIYSAECVLHSISVLLHTLYLHVALHLFFLVKAISILRRYQETVHFILAITHKPQFQFFGKNKVLISFCQ